ncbi:phosphopantothenate/pantothenate synthetase [Candidatus Gottesmanbacteria bacterium]|nr:phosphopantothenate/pantothenate synthetase [Candidatus Gottesmanbacteria bacterium]
MTINISSDPRHPRYLSNFYRNILSEGVSKGITSLQGLTAHGRGETFDYLIGEKTCSFARKSIEASACLFLLAKNPVISVNGNTAILAGKELVNLSKLLNAPLEINLFHASKSRERKINAHLQKLGGDNILLPDKTKIKGVYSNRKMISLRGQKKADLVFIPLEDGDRTKALIEMDKKVITIDLNPLSRTAQDATITIVDNIVRTLPLLIVAIIQIRSLPQKDLQSQLNSYDNKKNLAEVLRFIRKRLAKLAFKLSPVI